MSDQQYKTPEKPEGFRSYPDNLRLYADHFDKYRTAADSDMTGAMRRSAADVEALRAQLSEAQAVADDVVRDAAYASAGIRMRLIRDAEYLEEQGYIMRSANAREAAELIKTFADSVLAAQQQKGDK